MASIVNEDDLLVWHDFVTTFDLSPTQTNQFQTYLDLIIQENQKYNITAITGIKEIVLDHFYDSLAPLLSLKNQFEKAHSIVDVGSGGGFPGIPLAIMLPQASFHLIEVCQKKVSFLDLTSKTLGLSNITIHSQDWRNFLRNFNQPVNIFVARASLAVVELLRVFKLSLPYVDSLLVYWASCKWQALKEEHAFLYKCLSYQVGLKQRQLCMFVARDKNLSNEG